MVRGLRLSEDLNGVLNIGPEPRPTPAPGSGGSGELTGLGDILCPIDWERKLVVRLLLCRTLSLFLELMK